MLPTEVGQAVSEAIFLSGPHLLGFTVDAIESACYTCINRLLLQHHDTLTVLTGLDSNTFLDHLKPLEGRGFNK